jgi:hypothetical protein
MKGGSRWSMESRRKKPGRVCTASEGGILVFNPKGIEFENVCICDHPVNSGYM